MKCTVCKCMQNDRKKSNPDRQEFKYKLISYILGYNEGILGANANVEEDNTPDLENEQYSLTGKILQHINPAIEQQNLQEENHESELENINCDGLENLDCYICHKLKTKEPSIAIKPLEDSSYSWVNHLCEGVLSKPSISLMNILNSCDEIFMRLNGDKLFPRNGYLKKTFSGSKGLKSQRRSEKTFF